MAYPLLSRRRIPHLLIGLTALFAVTVFVGRTWLSQSLPILEGEVDTGGSLQAPVTIHRDAQGIPLIESGDRNSIAFALGFLHAQERFFQMDLLRRNSAGELSELVGEVALEQDKAVRRHQFRKRAEQNIAALPQAHRQLLDSYVSGVNFGLRQLKSNPWEYTLLGQEPEPWTSADSLLTIFSMYLTLQSPIGKFELRDTALADLLPRDLYEFYFPEGGSWDAPLIGEARGPVTIPDTSITSLLNSGDAITYESMESEDNIYGSNNWVVGGALTAHNGAIVANDMHLALNVPNIWYRAGWNLLGTGRVIRGATLPGGPIMVVGSNGKVAWGFTNTTADWGDLIPLELSERGDQYLTPEGWRNFEIERETIEIKGREPQVLQVKKTIWGPVVAENHRGVPLAYRWVAHDIQGANLNLLRLETAASAKEALDLGPSLGIPHQNMVVGDAKGHIGWTVAGPIPRRVGLDGSRSVSWADGSAYWDGYLSVEEQPRIYDPPSHRIWTANARTMDGEYLKVMGNRGYALGARQQQIRDRLFARDTFSEQDLLNIQLDDRAIFLQRWQEHLLELLDGEESYTDVRHQVKHWGGRASADSVGYRIVRNYRLKFMELTTAPILSYMRRYQPDFSFGPVKRQFEYALWEMAQREPSQLLNPDYESWRALKFAALNQVLQEMSADNRSLQEQTWGVENTVRIQHPLGKAIAAINWFTAMPADQLPGDTHMPRFQSTTNGASERMVVAPGREDKAIFHMATGQSAHPLSPFFDRGHKDWVEGNPSPLVESESRYTLRLR
ncbi:penicillin acylase family protein [Microbulbifer thermotolerans]|uniref:penicillin acylase family protein n=1 Tax=Microbulbifer thermotolerans TaxID=252514 RepID=UPI0022490C69|nr:penicillin acylase family protein [Microbulbifer thermotolerans]MCX2831167.1 penicillin acylase family protein [Microbulbifer thermotolerans]